MIAKDKLKIDLTISEKDKEIKRTITTSTIT